MREKKISAYYIADNQTLMDIAEGEYKKPSELSSIYGIGENKIEMYGKKIIEVITEVDKSYYSCKIFLDVDYNKYSYDNKIIYFDDIDDYHKKSDNNSCFVQASKRINKLRNMDLEAIRYYYDEINEIIDVNIRFVVCVMPSSQMGLQPSGIRIVATKLCKNGKVINGTDVLYRNKTLPKKHLGETKDSKKEKASITVRNRHLIENKQILLLDDVTITGTSLNVGKQILLDNGAYIVAKVALANTC